MSIKAHQPDLSSTMLVEQGENTWVLQIRAALTAFEYEIENHFGKDSYATPEEFQELVVKHIRENTSILLNDNDVVTLENGLVKLGHETSVTFEVVGTPSIIQSLEVQNKSFSNISRNQSALIVVKKGFAKDQFILDKNNSHTAKLKVKDSKFELVAVTSIEGKTQYAIFIFASVLFVLSIMYSAFKHVLKKK